MHSHLIYALLIAVSLVASLTDWRSGLIPNWLTLPVAALAPFAHLLWGGPGAALGSIVGLVVAGATPLLFFRLGAMGGGDVKLFAALGALAGPQMGLEIQLLALSTTFFWGLSALAWRGGLVRSLRSAGQIAINLVLPRARRRPIATENLTSMRIGGAILVGTLLSVVNHALLGGMLL